MHLLSCDVIGKPAHPVCKRPLHCFRCRRPVQQIRPQSRVHLIKIPSPVTAKTGILQNPETIGNLFFRHRNTGFFQHTLQHIRIYIPFMQTGQLKNRQIPFHQTFSKNRTGSLQAACTLISLRPVKRGFQFGQKLLRRYCLQTQQNSADCQRITFQFVQKHPVSRIVPVQSQSQILHHSIAVLPKLLSGQPG